LRVLNQGGQRAVADDKITVTGADSAMLLLAAATDFDKRGDWQKAPSRALDLAARPFDALLAEHVGDYQRYFRRVDLELGDGPAELPTDRRLEQVKKGASDPGAGGAHFKYGRYLFISVVAARERCRPTSRACGTRNSARRGSAATTSISTCR
jgi:alpha-L-fucosidase 2